MTEEFLSKLKEAVINYEMETVAELCERALQAGVDPLDAIERGLAAGIKVVGEKFGKGEAFLPELVMAAETMKAGVAVLEPRLAERADERGGKKVLLATVQDDIHEIGKNLVATMLTANGFQVVDLGVNQKADYIIKKAREDGASMVGVSALMTTTMPRMRELIRLAEDIGERDKRKYIVGGAPVTDAFAKEIGSDGTAGDAAGAVSLSKRLLSVQ